MLLRESSKLGTPCRIGTPRELLGRDGDYLKLLLDESSDKAELYAAADV
jgi:hypothetical protein